MARCEFPKGFTWGVATSAAQIEGGQQAHGRGESIWDRFAATPGRISDGSDATVACDHYRRWREDIGHMRWLGIGAYRFSIAWPRILPEGAGDINAAGLDFYDGLVDALLEANIQPFITLYHWDLPQALEDRGGWRARETCDAFARYADIVTSRLGDRVKYWITHNEPWCIASLGHESGDHAPGRRNPAESLRVAHHLMLSHGLATRVIRDNVPDGEVGITQMFVPVWPASDDDADREAARRLDGVFNRWYLEPVFNGCYPDDAIADRVRRGHLEDDSLPFVQNGDMEIVATPIDFLGANYYTRGLVKAGKDGEPESAHDIPEEALTDMGWEVFPQGLYDILMRLTREYEPKKIYITENGAAYSDGPDEAGAIADARRITYLRGHLEAAHRAISDGVPLAGYFYWSLLDNFEWALGYTKRFGLYWVDFATQERKAKDSAVWYRAAVAANAVINDD